MTIASTILGPMGLKRNNLGGDLGGLRVDPSEKTSKDQGLLSIYAQVSVSDGEEKETFCGEYWMNRCCTGRVVVMLRSESSQSPNKTVKAISLQERKVKARGNAKVRLNSRPARQAPGGVSYGVGATCHNDSCD
ncbi:hypothetical protein SNK03_012721 [Fusarium graminearum]|uniref:Chromosome 3, complete genome n=2 Tax=Gibberella zeae TaxID=5518 RepID=I1SAL7_GIBZE|nr:hypothetical protein FGSG_13898 [Fusarium graminearum PH-1]CAF3483384.1 unnamed protein product [Fusarium graminearum]ESU17873.1 hypothetical protein FGSG_13898 [Fusarium graminearum PH-1]CAG1980434.1 unnamed protein product [Fusarium graminearum]CAG1981721.1 unnamed protein product [Fusarium graminearum]CAG1985424.1 unnamed protein product [Fusarium graminearum]|eukprot:XP_011325495.1 hypothetical protein FGSG_13898 [Fusarium graminearum PH-1]